MLHLFIHMFICSNNKNILKIKWQVTEHEDIEFLQCSLPNTNNIFYLI